jgi:hypothetical protein
MYTAGINRSPSLQLRTPEQHHNHNSKRLLAERQLSASPRRGTSAKMKKFKRKLSFASFYSTLEASIRKRERRRTISTDSDTGDSRGSPQRTPSSESDADNLFLRILDNSEREKKISVDSLPDQDRLRLLNQHWRLARGFGMPMSGSQPDVRVAPGATNPAPVS